MDLDYYVFERVCEYMDPTDCINLYTSTKKYFHSKAHKQALERVLKMKLDYTSLFNKILKIKKALCVKDLRICETCENISGAFTFNHYKCVYKNCKTVCCNMCCNVCTMCGDGYCQKHQSQSITICDCKNGNFICNDVVCNDCMSDVLYSRCDSCELNRCNLCVKKCNECKKSLCAECIEMECCIQSRSQTLEVNIIQFVDIFNQFDPGFRAAAGLDDLN